MKSWFQRMFAVSALALLAACGGDDDAAPGTVVQVAQADARFSTLVEAVTAADLATTLAGPGPLTVFAPTNDAFAALLTELGITKAQLFADKALLTSVLTYHVLPARIERAQVPVGKAIATAQGGVFKVDAVGTALVATDGRNRQATITATDVAASNGLIHVVDKVLLPANKTIVQTAQALPGFGILVQAVTAANLAAPLSAPGPLTVFAPTDVAFADLLAELGITRQELLADIPLLTKVLTYHVVPGRVLKADVPVAMPIATLQGDSLSVSNGLVITDQRARSAHIVATDVLASNGVIHVLDKVILPRP